MKAKELSFIEGSGCYGCQTLFEPDTEVCFVSNYRGWMQAYHIGCAPKNGRPLGTRTPVVDQEGIVKENCIVCKSSNVHFIEGCLDCKERMEPKKELPPAKEEKKDDKTK